MAEKHFEEQRRHTRDVLLPYFREHIGDIRSLRILEVGCAEGGFLDVLREESVEAVGLEIETHRVKTAVAKNPELRIVVGDISDADSMKDIGGPFDLIVMRDVIEHVTKRESTLRNLRGLLNSDGYAYITFPPRFSPFAGHQQHGRTVLGKTPYLHLAPPALLRFLGKWFGEDSAVVETAIANGRIGLSIRRFVRLCRRSGFEIVRKDLFLIRPAFQTRYGIKPRRFPDIPVLNELFSMGCECLIRKK